MSVNIESVLYRENIILPNETPAKDHTKYLQMGSSVRYPSMPASSMSWVLSLYDTENKVRLQAII